MAPLLVVEGLSVSYGAIEALDNVNIELNAGGATAILGANGAGKTTLLRALSGMRKPSAGSIRFEGEEIIGRRPAQLAVKGIIHVPEGRGMFSRLTVRDNLHLGNHVRRRLGHSDMTLSEILDLFPRLAERSEQLAGTLSGGEQQMLAIARALVMGPKLLMLDEPSMGLSPLVVKAIFAALAKLTDRITILLVEQNVRAAWALASRAYLLESGRVISAGSAADLGNDESIRAAYLGR
jgi:branched-chain amino acid transport system ATP-binding protein